MKSCNKSRSSRTRSVVSFFRNLVNLTKCRSLCGKVWPRLLAANLSILTMRCRNSTTREVSFCGHSFVQEGPGKVKPVSESFGQEGVCHFQNQSLRFEVAHA